MSELEHQDTSILLPEASIAVYSKDNETLEAARALDDDWRFARVTIAPEEGDADTAIEVYQELHSPDLIIIQTDSIDEGFTDKLGELAGHCDEGTSAIVIGPDNDVKVYRELIEMGVSDYLVRPVESAVLAEVIAKALLEKIGVTGSRLIGVIGAKGGVGTSIIANALACGCANILKQKTVLLDTAGGWSSLSVGLAFEPSTTLSEAVKAAQEDNEDNIKRMTHNVNERLSVLATGADAMLDPAVDADDLEALIDTLMIKNPVVIVDLSNSPETLQRMVLSRANQIWLVSSPMLPSLRLARTLIQEIQEIRGGEDDVIEFIVNQQGLSTAHEVPKKDIEAAIDRKVSAFVPFDPKSFIECESNAELLSENKDVRGILQSDLLPLARKVIHIASKDEEADAQKKDGLLGGFLSKLSSGS